MSLGQYKVEETVYSTKCWWLSQMLSHQEVRTVVERAGWVDGVFV